MSPSVPKRHRLRAIFGPDAKVLPELEARAEAGIGRALTVSWDLSVHALGGMTCSIRAHEGPYMGGVVVEDQMEVEIVAMLSAANRVVLVS